MSTVPKNAPQDNWLHSLFEKKKHVRYDYARYGMQLTPLLVRKKKKKSAAGLTYSSFYYFIFFYKKPTLKTREKKKTKNASENIRRTARASENIRCKGKASKHIRCTKKASENIRCTLKSLRKYKGLNQPLSENPQKILGTPLLPQQAAIIFKCFQIQYVRT